MRTENTIYYYIDVNMYLQAPFLQLEIVRKGLTARVEGRIINSFALMK